MIIRSTSPPFVEFVVSSEEEIQQAYRAIHQAAGIDWGKPADRPNPVPPPCGDARTVLAALQSHLWSFDLEVLRMLKSGRARRMAVEQRFSEQGHSFAKLLPRIERMARSIGQTLDDFLVIEKLGDGLARETWWSPGPTLLQLPLEELERIERELRAAEPAKP